MTHQLQAAFLKANPTRKIDLLIHTKVMGNDFRAMVVAAHKHFASMFDSEESSAMKNAWKSKETKLNAIESILPLYVGNIYVAMTVVENMAKREPMPWMVTIMNWHYYGERYYTVKFRDSSLVNKEITIRNESLPRAICCCALRALGIAL